MGIEFALIAAVVTGVIGIIIGQRKGSPVWGFAMGFLLSVIGLAIVALSKPKEQAGR